LDSLDASIAIGEKKLCVYTQEGRKKSAKHTRERNVKPDRGIIIEIC
jgi:hypothetical protein